MSRLIVSMLLALTLAQTQVQTQAQTQAQAQGPRGTGLRQGEALQSPGKKGNVVENARLMMKLKMMKMMRGRFSHEFFFLAHGWSSAIYKRRNGTSIKYYNKF